MQFKTDNILFKTNNMTDFSSIFIIMNMSTINIGEKIKQVIAEKGITKAELSRRLNVRPQSVDYLVSRKSVDTDMLYNISLALDYDFALLYSIKKEQTDCDTVKKTEIPIKTKVIVELELTPDEMKNLNILDRIKKGE